MSSDDDGLALNKSSETYVDKNVLQNIIRNAMIYRDEEKEFSLATEKERVRDEVNKTKKELDRVKLMNQTFKTM